MNIEYWCRKCEKDVGKKQYLKSKFCPDCGTFLEKKERKKVKIINDHPQVPTEIPIEDFELKKSFQNYMKFSPIAPGGGVVFISVDDWIRARKAAYTDFRNQFSIEKLDDLNYLKRTYKNWLQFKNNLSWTTLQRTGYYAFDDLEGLKELIISLQNEKIDVKVRVRRGLTGQKKVIGIGPGILTGLLHTFFNNNYCVWNRRTKETIQILGYPTASHKDVGYAYEEVNQKLHSMANFLNTDLTTLDGYMWYISKYIRFV